MSATDDEQRMANALMQAYRMAGKGKRVTLVFQDYLKECPFCGSDIDLDCHTDCVMLLAEETSLRE